MNVFLKPEIAVKYDDYYKSDFGRAIDKIEKELVSDLIKEIPRDKMLELGCGTGHWSEYFEEQGFDVLGIDISEAMLNLAKKKGLKAKFQIADSENLPFETDSFSIIASITMLEFVKNQDVVLQEIYRVLKPGGWLILGCLNANSVLGNNKNQDETFIDAKFFTISEIEEKLKQFGKVKIHLGCHLSPDFKILDNTTESGDAEPVFIAAIIEKEK